MTKISPIFSCFDYKNTATDKTRRISQDQTLAYRQYVKSIFPEIHNAVIISALEELSQVEFDIYDISYINSLGAKLAFSSGRNVVEYLKTNNTKIIFEKIPIKGVYGQYNYKDNAIIINHDYKNSNKKADILAVAEAIIHEAGHSKDKDFNNSVQEEIDNLALNVLTHKYFSKKYPGIYNSSDSPIVKDGVNVYANLFFDNDPDKNALVARLRQKYGYLPSGDVRHPFSVISLKVKEG